jgi:hypothetical protein
MQNEGQLVFHMFNLFFMRISAKMYGKELNYEAKTLLMRQWGQYSNIEIAAFFITACGGDNLHTRNN